jgi:ring-1,2-phenylacetyl-CoA epoxidase subunit PaaA
MSEDQKTEEFLSRIDAQETIEPKEWMPDRYRSQLIRMMSQHAHSEIVGMLPEGNWITRAPSLRRKIALLAKVQDEAGHGHYIYSAVETLGVSRQEVYQRLLDGSAKYSHIFNYPTTSWADIGMIGWLVDGAAIINQTMLAKCSYGPYARAMLRICKEENFHKKQGMEIVSRLCQGTEAQKAMAQESFDRWWWPTLMMFGLPDEQSRNTEELMRYRVKLRSNDELRQRFIDMNVEQAHEFGLTVPDPNLHFDEDSRHWQIGPIPWDEFFEVLKGNGPCNRERLEAKIRAHEEGQWVREAAAAFAQKQENRRSL